MKRIGARMLVFIATLLVSVGVAYAQGHPWMDDPGQLGHYAIGHTGYLVTDKDNNNRPVYVGVWYPADASSITYSTPPAQYPLDPYTGTTNLPVTLSTDWEAIGYDRAYEGLPPSKVGAFPLLVFSPGYGDGAWQHIFTGTRLASHGYVVAIADHYGDCDWPWSACDEFMTTVLNRARDVSFVISQLMMKNRTRHELLFQSINPDKIAVSGHSLGGYPTYAMAAGDNLLCDSLWAALVGYTTLPYPAATCVPIPRDPRVKLIIPLDGASHFLRYRELSRISVPSLIMGETVDQEEAFGISRTWVARPHAAIDRFDSYRVDINGANHYSFTNYCDGWHVLFNLGLISADVLAANEGSWPCTDTGPNPVTISSADAHEVVNRYMIAFLDIYFRNPDSAPWLDWWILTPQYALTHTPTVQFFNSEHCHVTLPDDSYFAYRPYQTSNTCEIAQKDPTGWFAPDNNH